MLLVGGALHFFFDVEIVMLTNIFQQTVCMDLLW